MQDLGQKYSFNELICLKKMVECGVVENELQLALSVADQGALVNVYDCKEVPCNILERPNVKPGSSLSARLPLGLN